MSNALLIVKFKDGFKLYSQYQGSSDCAYPNLFDSAEEAWSHSSHDSDGWKALNYGRSSSQDFLEDVIIHSEYGGGFSWPGKANRKSKVLHGPLSLNLDDS